MGIEGFIDCITNRDPAWVEIAYLTIVRRRQMEELRMIPEDEWPSREQLQSYSSNTQEDINYYEPDDLIVPLSLWLRDKRIRQRKEQSRQRREHRSHQILNSVG